MCPITSSWQWLQVIFFWLIQNHEFDVNRLVSAIKFDVSPIWVIRAWKVLSAEPKCCIIKTIHAPILRSIGRKLWNCWETFRIDGWTLGTAGLSELIRSRNDSSKPSIIRIRVHKWVVNKLSRARGIELWKVDFYGETISHFASAIGCSGCIYSENSRTIRKGVTFSSGVGI